MGAPNWELWGGGAPQIQRAYDGLEPPSQRRGSLEPSQGWDRHQDDIRCRVAFRASVAAPAATFEKDSAAAYLPHQARQMGDGKMGERGRLWRSGPASAAPAMGIRTHKHLPKGPAEGGALGDGLLGPQIPQALGA